MISLSISRKISLIISSLTFLIIAPNSIAQESKITELEFWSGTAADLMLEEEQMTPTTNEFIFLENNNHNNKLSMFNYNSAIIDTSFGVDKIRSFSNLEIEAEPTSDFYLTIENNDFKEFEITEKYTEFEESLEENSSPQESDLATPLSWDFKIQPYYTIPWQVTGNATVQGITVDLDLGLGELLDTIQAYANTRFEGWRGRWGIIVDASYWSFGGIGDFDKPLEINDRIEQRIREDLASFTEQTIETVDQLIDREQEFFNQFKETENTLVNQLINQEIETFRQRLIDDLNQVNDESRLDSQSLTRSNANPLDEINREQIQVSERLSNGFSLIQSLNDLHQQLLNQTLTLRESSLPFPQNNQDRENNLSESSSIGDRERLDNIRESLEEIGNQTELVDVSLPNISSRLDSQQIRENNLSESPSIGDREKLDNIRQILENTSNQTELFDVSLPNISSRLDSQPIKVSERLLDSFNAAETIKDLQEELINQTLKFDDSNLSPSLTPTEKNKLEKIRAILDKIEEEVIKIDGSLPNNLTLEDFATEIQNRIEPDLLDNVNRIQEVRDKISNLQQKLDQALSSKEKLEEFRNNVLEDVSDLQVDLFRSLLNITEYSQQLRQEINELEQKLEEVGQELQKLEELREQILEAKLLLEIELFQNLIAAEIELLSAFDQRLDQEFSEIYNGTVMILEDLQAFQTVLNNAESDVDNFELIGNLSLDYSQGTYDFALSYNFGEFPVPYNPDGENETPQNFPLLWFEPIAGVRLNDFYLGISADISYQFDGDFIDFSGDFQESFIEKRTWFEPLLGGKLGLQVSPPIILWLRGDVSGFGLAGDTNLTWNFFAGLDWWVSPRTSLLFAYRFYQFDYGLGSGRDRNELKINFNGPTLGVSYHF